MFQNIISALSTVFLGALLAFILNVPMSAFERLLKKLFWKKQGPSSGRLWHAGGLLLTIGSLFLLVGILVTMVIPALTNSVQGIYQQVQNRLPEWIQILDSYGVDADWMTELMSELNLQDLWSGMSGSAVNMLQSFAGVAASTFSAVGTGVLAIVIAFYILLSKEEIVRQCRKLLHAWIPPKMVKELEYTADLVHEKYTAFLTGQCLEALILGSLIFVVYFLLGIPYAGLIAILTGFCSFVPYVGSFSACSLGVVLILMVDPFKAVLSIIAFLVIQFVEGQLIYPHVVGNSVGLSPFWTLIAVIIGGKLFGVVGMLFFIPLMAVIYTLVGRMTNKRLEKLNE